MSSSPIKRRRVELCKDPPLIWKQGLGPTTTGSVLVKLAQSGFFREAHQIIGVSHIASLIGRDSDGGLPELIRTVYP